MNGQDPYGMLTGMNRDGAAMKADLERMAERWAEQAFGIGRTHGWKDPAAKALRRCIKDLKEYLKSV